ncbi:zinc knuckle CX2CX4HX4C containing protein [Tanacetum coccineum]
MAEGEINNLTMEQYLALTRGNQVPGVIKPEIGGNVNFKIKSQFMRELREPGVIKPEIKGNVNFKIKSQFMRELREDTFFENKNDDAHEHVEPVLDIISLLNILGVIHDAVMLRVFPITLTGAAKRYCPPSKTAKQLKEICNFKQEGDETLYQAWERYNDLLYKCPTHDINSHQKHDSSSRRNIESSSNSEGIAAIVSKLDSLGRDMKTLKENVYAIQVGYQNCGGAQFDKECPLNEEVKSMEEVKYGEFDRPFPNNNQNDSRFNRGISRYGSHDPTSSGLETKVKSLTNEVEGRTNCGKFKECKAIFNEDGLPLYTPFYYSPEEIEYFYANSGLSDNERQETDDSGNNEALVTLDITPEIKQVPKDEKQSVCYHVVPYEPPIPFPRRLEHHAKEALVHKTMESLKKIRINRPLLKEIRQTDNYAKHMKDLVANKPKTEKDEDIRMNPRLDFNNALADLGASISVIPFSMYKCLGLGILEPINMVIEMADNMKCTPNGIVENLLIKIDKFIFPVDFVILEIVEDFRMPIILGRPLLATAHAKVDILRKSISLEVGNEKVIYKMRSSFTTIIFESVSAIRYKTSSEDDDLIKIDYDLFLNDFESCEFNRLLGINPDIFSYDIDIQISYEEIVYMITKVVKETHLTPKEKKCIGVRQSYKKKRMCASIRHLVIHIVTYVMEEMKIRFGKVCKMARERILKDHWRERFGDEEDDIEENLEDPKECGEDKANVITRVIHDKLNDDWLNGTSEDEDGLEGILEYLEPKSYDGFIDLDYEAYNKRKYRLLGLTYKEPPPILIEKVKITRYTIGLEEIYTKVKLLGIDEMPRTRDNIAAIRAGLMKKMAKDGSGQAKTFSQQGNGIRGDTSLIRIILTFSLLKLRKEQSHVSRPWIWLSMRVFVAFSRSVVSERIKHVFKPVAPMLPLRAVYTLIRTGAEAYERIHDMIVQLRDHPENETLRLV